MKKLVSILGSTGSIGRNTMEVLRRYPDRFEVCALAARGSKYLLLDQIKEFHPRMVAVYDDAVAQEIKKQVSDCVIVSGLEGLVEAASIKVDVVLCAIVGAIGLTPLLAAIRSNNDIAVANKEPIVMAGKYVMEEAAQHNVKVLPVDSEHSAIFQCLLGSKKGDVHSIHLTASGGPFYKYSTEQMRNITPDEAMSHPTWDMGAKISVDSATLMNKGLEIIEAMWLFGLELDQINVVIHPQSTIHSLVEFADGSLIAQLGVTDMKIPIAYALGFPSRLPMPNMRLDLSTITALTFDKPDSTAFPCLNLARRAAALGGTAPAILNAANEEAVAAFCQGEISFLKIADVVEHTLEHCGYSSGYSLEDVLAGDRQARFQARSFIDSTLGNNKRC